MLCHVRPLGDWLPAAATLWRLATGHLVLASQAIQPTATKTSATSPCTNTRLWGQNRNKWHFSSFPAWGLQFNPWGLEVWLLPWKRGDCHPGVVWGKELLLCSCILNLLLCHPPTGEKWYPLVFLSSRFSILLACINKRHIPRTERYAREGGEDLLPSRHPYSRRGDTLWDRHAATCQGEWARNYMHVTQQVNDFCTKTLFFISAQTAWITITEYVVRDIWSYWSNIKHLWEN